MAAANKSLQGTFDSRPIFASAKTIFFSNAPKLRRYVSERDDV